MMARISLFGVCELDCVDVEEEGQEDDWLVVDSMVLPPPPSAETDIAHYERATYTDASHFRFGLTDSFRNLLPTFPTTIHRMYNRALSKNLPSEEK